jgi:hypothetical protein
MLPTSDSLDQFVTPVVSENSVQKPDGLIFSRPWAVRL